jgi:shikimate kinase
MNIVLIGYRGTGKSVVGRLVAERLGLTCVSMDARIVEKAGLSIPELVQKQGWPAFRDLESAVARELAGLDDLLIDTGGGVIERQENIDVLRENGLIVWLQASPELIVTRIADGTERPSLTGRSFTEEVAEVLESRTPKYRSAAQFAIDTEQFTPEEVAGRIADLWKRGQGSGNRLDG